MTSAALAMVPARVSELSACCLVADAEHLRDSVTMFKLPTTIEVWEPGGVTA